jgi:hypothetical protein
MTNGRFSGIRVGTLALAAALLSGSTGCGAISALTNPKAAWAFQEPAPMAVILRRADAARATATNVDRLLNATPIDASSKWIAKIALKKADVEVSLKEIGTDQDYVVPANAKLRVIPAEAWAKVLSGLCPHESKFPNMFASVNAEVGTAYVDVAGQARTIGKLKSDKEAEVTALDVKDISASDKEAHEKKKKEIEDQIDKTNTEYKPKVDAFMAKLKEEAAKASPEVKKQLSLAMVGFKHAVDDAKMANSVALLRYPMAMPGMPQELKTQAKRIVADVIEDKTGHRPTLEKFDPDIKLDNGVKFTLNGMPPEALAGIKPEALLEEITIRAKDYATHVLTLTAFIAETQDLLDLEGQVIKTTMDAIEADEAKVTGAGDDLGEIKVELDAVAAAAGAGAVTAKAGKGGKASRHPVPMTSCSEGKAPNSADDKGGKGGKGKGGKGPEKALEKAPPKKK